MRLHRGDDAASLIPQGAGLIQFVVIAGGDEPTVARQQGRFGHKRVVEQVQEFIVPTQIGDRLLHQIGRVTGHIGGDQQSLFQPVSDCGQIARPAAFKREAR